MGTLGANTQTHKVNLYRNRYHSFLLRWPHNTIQTEKNFYLFSRNIYHHKFVHGTWSFFEASHGKSAADGIGGAIKRTLDSRVAQGKDIPDAQRAFEELSASDTRIKIFYITLDDIKPLLLDPGTTLIVLKNTMKVHQLITSKLFNLKHRELSCFCKDLGGRCDCYSPVLHSFEQNKERTEASLVLDEGTGELKVQNEERTTKYNY